MSPSTAVFTTIRYRGCGGNAPTQGFHPCTPYPDSTKSAVSLLASPSVSLGVWSSIGYFHWLLLPIEVWGNAIVILVGVVFTGRITCDFCPYDHKGVVAGAEGIAATASSKNPLHLGYG